MESADRLTADKWSHGMGREPRGFAGRGLEGKNDQGEDDQILAVLQQGVIVMPLWGVSLSPEAARSFGGDNPRWVFEIVGEFPAVPVWQLSGIKPEEEELVCGGRYAVESMSSELAPTRVTLRYLGPARDAG